MSYREEFPDYDDKGIYIPKGWTDGSYHNDTCPHAYVRTYDDEVVEAEARIWQDYKEPAKREYESDKRYLFEIVVNGEPMFQRSTDDLEEIKNLAKGVII